jgi:hypothetical protein
MIWSLFRRAKAAPVVVPAIDPRRFDALGNDLSALTKRVRREVIAARKAEITEALKTGASVRWAR